jgi:steroid 5-alpha reductase family enzyme
MWEIHYLYRTLLYPFMMRGGNKSFPFLLVAFAFAFNIINGYINGIYLFSLADPYGTDWLLDPRFIAGSLIFIAGLAINIHSDGVLRGLRRPGENNYRIPYGGLFRYVSNPNYLGEIIEWSGWALATWSLPGLAFALFTIANLAPRARANHRWYKEKFIEYPAERKILIPFIY